MWPIYLRARAFARNHGEPRYTAAKIFVHAAGFGDPDDRPELAEHFGIATVEAMAAGCVPIVVNKGGQPEIVQHGTSGFVWNTLDELKGFTRMLMNDPELCARMSRAARQRAQRFSQAAFLREMSRRAGIATPYAAALPVSA